MSLARLRSVNTADPRWSELLRSIVARIRAVEPACQIRVFGSFARDQFTEASDIDIAVILDPGLRATPKEVRSRLSAGGPLSRWPVDLIVLPGEYFQSRKEGGGVCVDIEQEGIELYPEWRLHERENREI